MTEILGLLIMLWFWSISIGFCIHNLIRDARRGRSRGRKITTWQHQVVSGPESGWFCWDHPSYESMLVCERAWSENEKWLAGDPLAMYGQYLPDPMFRPVPVESDRSRLTPLMDWGESVPDDYLALLDVHRSD